MRGDGTRAQIGAAGGDDDGTMRGKDPRRRRIASAGSYSARGEDVFAAGGKRSTPPPPLSGMNLRKKKRKEILILRLGFRRSTNWSVIKAKLVRSKYISTSEKQLGLRIRSEAQTISSVGCTVPHRPGNLTITHARKRPFFCFLIFSES